MSSYQMQSTDSKQLLSKFQEKYLHILKGHYSASYEKNKQTKGIYNQIKATQNRIAKTILENERPSRICFLDSNLY